MMQGIESPLVVGWNDLLIKVRVTPGAKESRVEKVDVNDYEVRVDEAAMEGRANKRLIEVLSEHFRVPKSNIVIVRGSRSRDKILEILPPEVSG